MRYFSGSWSCLEPVASGCRSPATAFWGLLFLTHAPSQPKSKECTLQIVARFLALLVLSHCLRGFLPGTLHALFETVLATHTHNNPDIAPARTTPFCSSSKRDLTNINRHKQTKKQTKKQNNNGPASRSCFSVGGFFFALGNDKPEHTKECGSPYAGDKNMKAMDTSGSMLSNVCFQTRSAIGSEIGRPISVKPPFSLQSQSTVRKPLCTDPWISSALLVSFAKRTTFLWKPLSRLLAEITRQKALHRLRH